MAFAVMHTMDYTMELPYRQLPMRKSTGSTAEHPDTQCMSWTRRVFLSCLLPWKKTRNVSLLPISRDLVLVRAVVGTASDEVQSPKRLKSSQT